MSQAKFVLGAAAILAVASCSHQSSQPPPENAYSYQQDQQSSQTTMGSGQMKTCPMAVPGTEVSVADTASGIALSFTTGSGDVNDLRSRVSQAADRYRAQSGNIQGGSLERRSPGSTWSREGLGGQTGFGPQGPMNGPPVTTPDSPAGTGSAYPRSAGSGAGSGGYSGGSGSSGDNSGGFSGGSGGPSGNTGPSSNPSGTLSMNDENIKVAYVVYSEDIDRGARLVFTPQNPGQLDTLRSEIRQHATMMQPGDCPPPRISREWSSSWSGSRG